jgi:hypothetical protein
VTFGKLDFSALKKDTVLPPLLQVASGLILGVFLFQVGGGGEEKKSLKASIGEHFPQISGFYSSCIKKIKFRG